MVEISNLVRKINNNVILFHHEKHNTENKGD